MHEIAGAWVINSGPAADGAKLALTRWHSSPTADSTCAEMYELQTASLIGSKKFLNTPNTEHPTADTGAAPAPPPKDSEVCGDLLQGLGCDTACKS